MVRLLPSFTPIRTPRAPAIRVPCCRITQIAGVWSAFTKSDRVPVAIVGIGSEFREFAPFQQRLQVPSQPGRRPLVLICRSRETRNLSRDLKIAKGVLSDDADDLKAIPTNFGSLLPSPSGKRVPNAPRTGLRCRTSD